MLRYKAKFYAEVGGEVFEQPRQQIVNRALGGGLLKVIAAKLQLASRATQIHDEVLGDIARQAEAIVFSLHYLLKQQKI